MDLFSILTLLGGLAFFLYGMVTMSTGLEKMAGGKLERTLQKMTSNPFKSILLGAGITIAIQSSSALTVMLVGLVNSGIMRLGQTIGVIMGSNIGTTLTAWLLSLTGIESNNIFLKLLKPDAFSPIVAFVGILLIMISKQDKKKDIGKICIGFAVLMFGMNLMSSSVSPLAESPEFSNILTMFTNPLLGVLVGAVFTGIIQSSAASVGILQALSLTGSITYGMALPIIMGQNIGTCITSVLSSIGVNKNAKRVAVVHIYFNLIGTVLFLIVFYLLDLFLHFSFLQEAVNPFGIAVAHSIFNVVTTIVLLPFHRFLEKLANLTIREKNVKEKYEFLDERLLLTPTFAITQCRSMTSEMAYLARDTLFASLEEIRRYSEKLAVWITENEERLDHYEDKLGTYLVKISSKSLTEEDSREVSKLLHTIGDFERIGDHAVNILRTAREMHEKKLSFSAEAQQELEVITNALTEILTITTDAFDRNDLELAAKVEPLEQVIDGLKAELKSRHIARLQDGSCTIELGFILSDLLTNYERVSDHCSNIAVCLIQIHDANFDTHEYLNKVKTSGNAGFLTSFEEYHQKYLIP